MSPFKHIRYIYFLGIGGIGMSALARYFMKTGRAVAGYDRSASTLTRQLETEGAVIHYEDDPESIPPEFTDPDQTLVIYTPAIPSGHSEMNRFKEMGLQLVKRAEVLGMITRDEHTIAVAGSHGKTTVSSMITKIFFDAPGDCVSFLGGIAKNFNSNLVLKLHGNEKFLITEADEFDRSFLKLSPAAAIITSADPDHLDIYGTGDAMLNAFSEFANKVIPGGILLLRKGIPLNIMREDISLFSYSLDEDSDFRAELTGHHEGLYTFRLITPFGVFDNLQPGVPGLINIENAVGACAMALLHKINIETVRKAIAGFTGIIRRFDYQLRSDSLIYIDDYAHHPGEISATLHSLREIYPGRKITGIFQPHLYTRTRDFADGFAASLETLDEIILLPIYPARELPLEGVTTQIVLDKISNPHKSLVEKENLLADLEKRSIEILITMGAGDIDRLVTPITELLKKRLL